MATLRDYRKQQRLTLEQVAEALGLRVSSASWLSEIENGKRDASVGLAMTIEVWSGGEVTAESVSAKVAAIRSKSQAAEAAA